MNQQQQQLFQQAAGEMAQSPPTDLRVPQREQKPSSLPISAQANERTGQSDSLRMAIEMSQRIQQQTQNLIRDRIKNVQKQVQEQAAEQKRGNLTREVVSVVEKQVLQQQDLARSFKERISNSNAAYGSGTQSSHHNTVDIGRQHNDSFNHRDTGGSLQRDMAAVMAEAAKQPPLMLNMQALQRPNVASGVAQAQVSKQRPTPSFRLRSKEEPGQKEKNGDKLERDLQSSTRHGAGVQQVPVEDEVEPGHVPIAEIIKANHIEMQQQSGFQRPPSTKQKPAFDLVQRAGLSQPQKQQRPLKLDPNAINFDAVHMQMNQTIQESQQSGSGGNTGGQIMGAYGRVNPVRRVANAPILDTDGDRYEDQDQLNDIRQRANVPKDFSINMNTDDQLDDDGNTLDKDSQGNTYYTAGELAHSLDLRAHGKGRNMPGFKHADDGPKMARNMGFPNMKYLDPDAQGPPVQEKTLYKEFQQNKDNDIKLQREGFINARQDMANNTFIKLFQASENPDKREELQSVQYAEQILDDDTSGHEDTHMIVQNMGQAPGQYLERNSATMKPNQGLYMLRQAEQPQYQQQQYVQSSSKAKSKSLGKIGDHHVQDQSIRIKTRRKNSQASRQVILSPEKSTYVMLRQQPQHAQQYSTEQQPQNLSHLADSKPSQQLPPLQNPQNLATRRQFLLEQSNSNSVSFHHPSAKAGQMMLQHHMASSHLTGNGSDEAIRSALPGFQAPQGMTQVPMMFSGSIPSLQYQDSSKAIVHLHNVQQNSLSPAQAFLNQQLSTGQGGQPSQDGTGGRPSSLLPPILQNQKMQMARFQEKADQSAGAQRFGTQLGMPGKSREDGFSERHLQAQRQQAAFQIGGAHHVLEEQPQKYRVIDRIQDQEQSMQNKLLASHNQGAQEQQQPNLMNQLMPSSEVVSAELMNKFGGKELSVQLEMKRSRASPFGHSPFPGEDSTPLAAREDNRSCMSTQSPEVGIDFDPAEDKCMREILDQYRQTMSTGQTSKENLFLKKLRFHHPWFRELSFNAFKMLFDLCELVQIKKGQKLFKQDAQITDVYFVMYGQLALSYSGNDGVQDLEEGAYLGLTLGEELLFYEDPLYRETAVCVTARCCALQIKADYIMELGDENFMNRGLNSEAMKNDMDLMFERLSHIYNRKERWRITIATKEAEAAKLNETQYTQFIKSQ